MKSRAWTHLEICRTYSREVSGHLAWCAASIAAQKKYSIATCSGSSRPRAILGETTDAVTGTQSRLLPQFVFDAISTAAGSRFSAAKSTRSKWTQVIRWSPVLVTSAAGRLS